MQNTIPTRGPISWGRRLMPATAALGLLLVLGFAQPAPAQTASAQTTPPLNLFNNYFITGDYVVGGVGLRGAGDSTGIAHGTISIPDSVQAQATGVPSPGVPAGANIVAAFLYWETVEKNKSTEAGKNGFFNGQPITGVVLGNNTAPPGWSSGGCTGSSGGNSTTTLRGYRADVRPLLPVDANGNIKTPNADTPGSYQVGLADSGSNGGGTPLTLGATLVILWRVLNPAVPGAPFTPSAPLTAIVINDGAFAPSNQTNPEFSLTMQGFYQPDGIHKAKMTHIVGDGQANKSESVKFGNTTLVNLYPANSTNATAAFPGVYNTSGQLFNGSWDTATWDVTALVNGGVTVFDTSETTTVMAGQSGGGCVDWGAVIFSTTVQDTDGDGLLDAWESANPPGYTDAITGQFVALPGADPNVKDIFVEVDYLCNLASCDPNASGYLHSHLPKQQALDNVGNAFKNAPVDCDPITHVCKGVHVHFDVGNVYQSPLSGGPSANCGTQASPVACDPYIITNPAGTGGNAIPESATVCKDATSPTLCQFPGTSAVGWKGGFLFVKDNPSLTLPGTNTALPLGNFQPGRRNSYHYMLFGHDLGAPRSIWSTFGANLQIPSLTQLISIVNTGSSTATVTIQTPSGLLKPGDCPNPLIPACSSDLNLNRVTVEGAAGQPALNGTYAFASAPTPGPGPNQTTFTITTANVANGTYVYDASSCPAGQIPPCASEPRLAVEYGGPTSASGQSDFPGGADSSVMFGGWPADDPSNCQADPSQPLGLFPAYCNNQLGSVQEQGGTIMHELGHTLALAHGGTYYDNANHPSVSTYEFNCKSNLLTVMSYLFQARGFPDPVLLPDGTHPIDYSSQVFLPLDETTFLNESTGIDNDSAGFAALHLTRWYAQATPFDIQTGHFAKLHCDGTPTGPNETAAVLVDGTLSSSPGSTFSKPLDWNNDLIVPDAVTQLQDVNFNGAVSDAPFRGFNEWSNVDLLQVSSREGALGLSSGGGLPPQLGGGGGGLPPQLGGGGGGLPPQLGGGGGGLPPQLGGGGGGLPPQLGGGGGTPEQDQDMACSATDPPRGLTAKNSNKTVVLNWTAPGGPCQVRRYDVFRAQGNFPTLACALTTPATCTFTDITPNGIKGTPPVTAFTDTSKLQNNTFYTYFVTETNAQGATSGASKPFPILVLNK